MNHVATVEVVHRRRNGRIVEVRCPFCKRTHQHGWPYEHDEIGTRQAHCTDASYTVVAA